jgi:hypothetical protein
VTNSAPPGVDQPMVSGIRWRRENQIITAPSTTLSASSPEAAWAGDAPTPRSPDTMTAEELVYPTSALRMPAVTGWVIRSISRSLSTSGPAALAARQWLPLMAATRAWGVSGRIAEYR